MAGSGNKTSPTVGWALTAGPGLVAAWQTCACAWLRPGCKAKAIEPESPARTPRGSQGVPLLQSPSRSPWSPGATAGMVGEVVAPLVPSHDPTVSLPHRSCCWTTAPSPSWAQSGSWFSGVPATSPALGHRSEVRRPRKAICTRSSSGQEAGGVPRPSVGSRGEQLGNPAYLCGRRARRPECARL